MALYLPDTIQLPSASPSLSLSSPLEMEMVSQIPATQLLSPTETTTIHVVVVPENKNDETSTTAAAAPILKSQLKKLAKNKGKKEKKDKPTWGEPGAKAAAAVAAANNSSTTTPTSSASLSFSSQATSFVNTTPKGQKKDLSHIPFADSYHPAAVEAAWQDWWEQSGCYSCDPQQAVHRSKDEKFVMVIPPPNVTGSLHLGHALTAAVEDTLTRWHRMLGHATLYVPGTKETKLYLLPHRTCSWYALMKYSYKCPHPLSVAHLCDSTSMAPGRICPSITYPIVMYDVCTTPS
jgi:hypothetical protein